VTYAWLFQENEVIVHLFACIPYTRWHTKCTLSTTWRDDCTLQSQVCTDTVDPVQFWVNASVDSSLKGTTMLNVLCIFDLLKVRCFFNQRWKWIRHTYPFRQKCSFYHD